MHTHKKCRTINVHLYTLYMHAHVLSVCTCIYMYIHAYSMYMHVVYTDIHSLSLHSTQNLWNTNIYCQLYATERGGREWERRERKRERERCREVSQSTCITWTTNCTQPQVYLTKSLIVYTCTVIILGCQ